MAEARIEFLRGTEQSGDNRASSACAFRACASFRSAALRTAPSSAKQRSTLVRVRGSVRLDTLTTCRAVQGVLLSLTPLQLLLPQHLVLLRLGVPSLCAKTQPELRRAGLTSARGCSGQLLGSASLGQLAWQGEDGWPKGPCFAHSAEPSGRSRSVLPQPRPSPATRSARRRSTSQPWRRRRPALCAAPSTALSLSSTRDGLRPESPEACTLCVHRVRCVYTLYVCLFVHWDRARK